MKRYQNDAERKAAGFLLGASSHSRYHRLPVGHHVVPTSVVEDRFRRVQNPIVPDEAGKCVESPSELADWR